MKLFKKKAVANESLDATFEIVDTHKIGNVDYIEVFFKGSIDKFDEDIDYGQEYLGKPLWNGSVFMFTDSKGLYTWSQSKQKWFSQTN